MANPKGKRMMKNILKALLAVAILMLAAAALTITVCAEDYVFEISDPTPTSGEWDLAFIYETANAKNHLDNFDATWMTPESDVIVEYTYEGKCSKAPLELIWQTWKGPVEPDPDVKKNWNKVSPYEYNETSAKFSFEDIAKSYGTENFSTVYAINIGDRGVKLTVTGIKITNCNISGSESAAVSSETEAQTETEAETKTEAETTTEAVTQSEPQTESETAKETSAPAAVTSAEAETAVTESKPEEEGGGAAAVIVVIIIFVIMAAVMAAAYLSKKKKKKSRYY